MQLTREINNNLPKKSKKNFYIKSPTKLRGTSPPTGRVENNSIFVKATQLFCWECMGSSKNFCNTNKYSSSNRKKWKTKKKKHQNKIGYQSKKWILNWRTKKKETERDEKRKNRTNIIKVFTFPFGFSFYSWCCKEVWHFVHESCGARNNSPSKFILRTFFFFSFRFLFAIFAASIEPNLMEKSTLKSLKTRAAGNDEVLGYKFFISQLFSLIIYDVFKKIWYISLVKQSSVRKKS